MRRRRLAGALTALALATGSALVAPTTAFADDYCDYEDSAQPEVTGFAPSTIAVGRTPPLVKFSVRASDECGIEDWTMLSTDKVLVFAYKQNPSETLYTFDNDDAGSTYMDVSATDPAFNTTTKRFTFKVLRRTQWVGFNASPEPVKKGGLVRVTGRLQRVDWERDAYLAYGAKSQRAKVQFKAKGTSTYTTVKTVTLNSKSAVDVKIKASGAQAKDGTYRLVFAGNGVSAATTSAGDFVDVR